MVENHLCRFNSGQKAMVPGSTGPHGSRSIVREITRDGDRNGNTIHNVMTLTCRLLRHRATHRKRERREALRCPHHLILLPSAGSEKKRGTDRYVWGRLGWRGVLRPWASCFWLMPSDLKDATEHGTKCKSPGGIIKSRTKLSKARRRARHQSWRRTEATLHKSRTRHNGTLPKGKGRTQGVQGTVPTPTPPFCNGNKIN